MKETLECAFSQSGGKDEIIIVDDASTDRDTLDIIDDFRKRKYVKVVRHERNRGLGAARNTGVTNASAEIIVPLDADDLLAPGYFEKMLAPFSDPAVAFTYCDVQCFGDSNELWPSAPFDRGRILRMQYICGCSPFRKRVHEVVGGYCEEDVFRDMNEDWDFWLSVCEQGFKGVYVTGGLYLYRIHGVNMSKVPRTFSAAIQQRMLERHKEFILKYIPAQRFLAHGYEETGYAHLKKNEPLAAMDYILKLLTTPGKRLQGVRLGVATVRHVLGMY